MKNGVAVLIVNGPHQGWFGRYWKKALISKDHALVWLNKHGMSHGRKDRLVSVKFANLQEMGKGPGQEDGHK